LNFIIYFLLMALAVASICFTISKSELFNPIRIFIFKYNKGKLFYKLIHCPYCLSHWVAALFSFLYIFIFKDTIFGNIYFDFIVLTFSLVTVSSVMIGKINSSLEFMD